MPENTTLTAFIALLSPIILMVVGMIVLLMGVGKHATERSGTVTFIACAGCIGAIAVAAGNLATPTLSPSGLPDFVPFGGGMINDSLSATLNIVLAISAFLAILMSGRFLAEKHLPAGEFYALILFSASGGMVMAQAFDLVNIFVGLEVLSVALYILAGFARRELRSEEAAVKYFLLGAFTSAFLLFGCALVYGAVGITMKTYNIPLESITHSYTNLYTIATTLSATKGMAVPLATNPLFVTGAVLVIIGLCFKASIVPFHSYAPDVYEGSPIPVTAFMSAAAKAGAFAAFLRWFVVLIEGAGGSGIYKNLLFVLAAVTIVVGNILAVRQTSVKRMLAYSSIAHAGYLLVGLLASGQAGQGLLLDATRIVAQTSISYYLIVYTFMNLGAFAVLAWIGYKDGREYTQISDLAGLAKRNPLAAGVMTVFLLSLAGIPPAAGFFGKLYVFLAALNAGYTGLAALGLVASVIGAFYYLNLIVSMFFREGNGVYVPKNVGVGAKAAAIISAVATLLLGLIPIPNITPRLPDNVDRRVYPNNPAPTRAPAERRTESETVPGTTPGVAPAESTTLPGVPEVAPSTVAAPPTESTAAP